MSDLIRRFVECRAEGRRVSGVVMAFGDVSPSHRERFEPGSIQFADSVHLDLLHDPLKVAAWYPGGGMELTADDTAIRMTAELPPIPPADAALDAIRAASAKGEPMGLSVEFRAMKEIRESGLRVIQSAVLRGIGLVRNPSYLASRIEERGRRRRIWL